ncbi:hypothetical protein LRS13_11485 [Svornostia abyssi]|uniref:DUF4352 domain-containing protein n=1 Tax=Svornostia abyssi TaxID=2898438 RepID=A0ABY5PNE2_9ACTN|nr:hypothetical protein LRS13_11485 [Parviterribacteraceae bacterium J379]
MRWAGVVLAVVAFALSGCGDDGIDGAQFVEAVTLERAYTDGRGEARDVNTTMFLNALYTSERELPVTLPSGTQAVLADVSTINDGRDPFPLEWAVFTARTREGRTLGEKLRQGPRRVTDKEQVVSVGFAVPDGDEVTEVRMRSIVDVWPFRATLKPPRDDDT